MGKFILKCTLFILPLVAMVAGLEIIVRGCDNSYRYKECWMQENCDSVQTLIMGSSHTYYGINPQHLKTKAFNLANVSQDLKFDLYLLNRYIDSCPNLKTVILPISYFTLYCEPLECGVEKFRCKYYHHYMGYNDTLSNPVERLEIYTPEIFQQKLEKKLKEVITGKSDLDYNSLGWADNYTESIATKGISNEDVEKTVKRHSYTTLEYFDENISCLDAIAKLCHNKGVKLFVITTPTTPMYYNKLNGNHLKKMIAAINSVCLKYEASYYNYLTDERFDLSHFYDADHLCDAGAEKFTKILQSEIFE